jgi:Transmembrane secretion effector
VLIVAVLHRLSLVQLVAVALAVGMARVLFDIAHPSYLPALVDRDELVRTNAYLESSRSATQLTGPGLGGWLVQLAGAPAVVAADAVSFLASAGCLQAIRATEPRPARPGRRELRRELAGSRRPSACSSRPAPPAGCWPPWPRPGSPATPTPAG